MKQEAKQWMEAVRRKTRVARRWLRALISLLDDLMAVGLAGFFATGQSLATARSRKNGH